MAEITAKKIKTVLFVMSIQQILIIALEVYNLFGLNQTNHDVQMSRLMLDVRARIQIISVQANWDKFTPEERKFIKDNWEAAGYETATPIK